MDTLAIWAMLMISAVEAAGSGAGFPRPSGDAAKASTILEDALKRISSSKTSASGSIPILRDAAGSALQLLAPQSPAAERLALATDKHLEQVVRQVYGMLSFVPVKESELPTGSPTYTPVGAIEVKRYPVIRKAVAGQFFTLFMHIQKNKIAMTAPVQMDYRVSDGGELTQSNMAFLYGSNEIGSTGRVGRVQVVDCQPVEVVSIGARGSRSNLAIRENMERLENWIAANQQYRVAGPPRVMGYNSPFIPPAKQFYEVQIPITSRSTVGDR